MRFGLLGLLLIGCVEDPSGPQPIWRPGSDYFYDTPWPSDTRRDPDGTISMAGWPNPQNTPLLNSYTEFAEEFEGFGTSSPIYVAFGSAVDPITLPTPKQSTQPGSSVILVDIDPGSPDFGHTVPLQWELRDLPDSFYLPDHLLAVAPVYGFPLRRSTRHALIVTTQVGSRADGFDAVWDRDHPDHEHYADLLDVLPFLGLGTDDIAIATTFTTRDPIAQMRDIAWFVRERLELPDLDLDLQYLETPANYHAFRTHYPSPVFTHGERPYDLEGGGFEFEEDGTPIVHSWDDMRLAVCTPLDLSNPPPDGWPVVIYQHGTGGSYRGFCNSDGPLEVANQLAPAGLIGLGIDQPLHGPRGEGNDLTNFNLFNPDSGVTNFRQGAIDALYLAHALHDRQWTMTTPDGQEIPLDPNNVLFMGHSQGGLTGALAAPFFGGDVKAAMLSGAGGVLAITVVVRKDIIDFEAMISGLLELPEDEVLSPMYPVLGLVQMSVEVTDPVNYAPYWFAERGDWDFHVPTPILHTSGTADEATPYQTALALSASGRLPILRPQMTEALAHDLRELPRDFGPLSNNAETFDGTRVTAAFSQWRDGTHWVVFEEPEAADLYREYLRTAADGTPVAERD